MDGRSRSAWRRRTDGINRYAPHTASGPPVNSPDEDSVTLREAAAREKAVKGYGIELGRLLRGEHHGPVVYFARVSSDRVKIGTTTNLRKRP